MSTEQVSKNSWSVGEAVSILQLSVIYFSAKRKGHMFFRRSSNFVDALFQAAVFRRNYTIFSNPIGNVRHVRVVYIIVLIDCNNRRHTLHIFQATAKKTQACPIVLHRGSKPLSLSQQC